MSDPKPLPNLMTTGVMTPTPPVCPLLIDSKVACALLNLCARRLWSLTNCKAIPSRKIGRSVRYSPLELEAWILCGCPTKAGAGARVRKEMRS